MGSSLSLTMMAKPQKRTTRTDNGDVPTPIQLPDAVSSSEAKLVCLYLSVRGTATVDELGETLDLPKLTLFSIFGTLRENDLLVRDGDVVSLV